MPAAPFAVTVIVAVPGETAVTVTEFDVDDETVATAVLLEDQAYVTTAPVAIVGVAVRVTVPPTATGVVDEAVTETAVIEATGFGCVIVSLLLQADRIPSNATKLAVATTRARESIIGHQSVK
ncbi:MAG: hypothetical protein ABJC26_17005 [Gemmatimonadaceae bacterium]